MDWTVPLQAAIQKIRHEEYISALSDLEYVLQLSPTNVTALKWRGVVRYFLGQYIEAIGDLDMVVRFSEQQSSSVLRYRGEAKKMLGHYEAAKDDLLHALNIKRNHKTFQSLGDVNKLMERYDEALQTLNIADQMRPNDPHTLALRGEVKMMMELGAEALTDLNRALCIKSNDVYALCIRAELCKCMRRYNEALLDLDIAASIEPDNQHVISLRNEVRSIMPASAALIQGLVPSPRYPPRNLSADMVHVKSEQIPPPAAIHPESSNVSNNSNVISAEPTAVLDETMEERQSPPQRSMDVETP